VELPIQEIIGDWSWYDNPFIGSRLFAALVTVNVLLNNWDLKTSNNTIYVVTNEGSPGQRQPVALGRAIVREPRAFLLDEPLSNRWSSLAMRDGSPFLTVATSSR